MRNGLLLLLLGFVISLTSCRNDFEFEPSTGGLEFSRDTVYLDTVFSNIGSSTYTLKVYNRSDKDIAIPTLKLKKGEASNYRLMVDGMPGKIFNNVELMAKDSMFIFIETTVNIAQANPDDFLYTDEIEFYSSNGTQEVNLVTLVQDAIFLYPERNEDGVIESLPLNEGNEEVRVRGFNLDPLQNGNELHWTNTKPYVIYGYATVPAGQTLTVDPGARVHFHAGSGLMVRPGATLLVNGEDSAEGELTNEVIFEGDRLEPGFSEAPGQWLTVWLREGSKATLKNLTVKNAIVGILAEGNDGTPQPSLTLNNVQIYNSSSSGLLARNGNVYGENVAINGAGEASLALTLGGTYNFKHCTIANYVNSFNQVPLLLTDYQDTEEARLVNSVTARFDNCIFYGSGNFGILLQQEGLENGTTFNHTFNHCLIKFNDTSGQFANNALYLFDAGVNFTSCIIARNSSENQPDFLDPAKNKLNIGEESAANGTADATVIVPYDIIGTQRTGTPDIGAYESTIFED